MRLAVRAMAMAQQQPLHSAASVQAAKQEGEHHLGALRKAGLLGRRWPVRIEARRHVAGSSLKPGEKLVHLIRHGQGFHNLIADLFRDFGQEIDIAARDNPYNRPELLDPPLTATGRLQAQALQPQARELVGVQLVVVSPLRRATETALLAFAHLAEGGPGSAKVTFVGHADTHEERHGNICDKRRPMSEVRAEFPMVDWSAIADEHDPLWQDDVPESGASVSDRGYAFLLWLRDRPENEVAVGTHSAWLFTLLNAVVECAEQGLASWFLTGEMRSVVLRFAAEDGAAAKRARAG